MICAVNTFVAFKPHMFADQSGPKRLERTILGVIVQTMLRSGVHLMFYKTQNAIICSSSNSRSCKEPIALDSHDKQRFVVPECHVLVDLRFSDYLCLDYMGA